MLLDSKNLNKILQDPNAIDSSCKKRITCYVPGYIDQIESAIFRRNSILDPGSYDQIEKK
jgi:hypothetical protein